MVDGAPLMELEESWMFGLWPRRLLIFEDRIETHEFELLRETTRRTEYGQIGGVTTGGRAKSTSLLIRRRQDKPILMRGLEEAAAGRAKALIEQCIARSVDSPEDSAGTLDKAALLGKLAELREAGVLGQEEFEAKRKTIEANEP